MPKILKNCPVCKHPINEMDSVKTDPEYGLVHSECKNYIENQKKVLSESINTDESLDDVIKQTKVL